MQVSTIVVLVEVGLATLVVFTAVAGFYVGLRRREPAGALLVVALASAVLMIAVLVGTRGLAVKYGPLVTRQMLLLCFSLALALIGGCCVGLARQKGTSRSAVVGGAVVAALIAILMGVFFTRIREVLEAAGSVGAFQHGVVYIPQKNKDCPENLKSLYVAFQQYAQDWDALPPAANWMGNDDLVSKVRQNEWLHCPIVSNRQDDRYGYAYNEAVAARKLNGKPRLADLPDAAKTPLLYNSTDLAKSAHDAYRSLPRPGRHGGRDNVLFLDGHVEAVAPK